MHTILAGAACCLALLTVTEGLRISWPNNGGNSYSDVYGSGYNTGVYTDGCPKHVKDRLKNGFLAQRTDAAGQTAKIDLVYVIQSSRSIGYLEFPMYKAHVRQMTKYFSPKPSYVKMGVVSYGKEDKVQLSLNDYTNHECVGAAADKIPLYDGDADISSGIETAYRMLTSRYGGARKDSKKLIHVLTDGNVLGMEEATGYIKKYASSGVDVYVMGTGNSNNYASLYELGDGWTNGHFYNVPLPCYLPSCGDDIPYEEPQDQCCGTGPVLDQCNRRCDCNNGTLVNCCRVRKEFSSMSVEERTLYLETYITLTTVPPYKAQYDAFILIHRTQFGSGIHGVNQFLPWHRWYMLELENMLREIDCRVTVPYWDWSLWANDPWTAASIWGVGPDGLGGNGVPGGSCVTTGQFAAGSWSLPDGTCLRRNFNGNLPDQVAVANVLSQTNFFTFENLLSGLLHDNVHCRIGATMCTSAAGEAPEFFLHHGYIDKLWNDWQQQSTANFNAHFPSVPGAMTATTYQAVDLIDISNQPGSVRVCYDEPSANFAKEINRTLHGLGIETLQKIPRIRTQPVPETAKALFKWSREKRVVLDRLQSTTFWGALVEKPFTRGTLDSILGFSLKSAKRIASTSNSEPATPVAISTGTATAEGTSARISTLG